MKKVIDGEEYVSSNDALSLFFCSQSALVKFRTEGMPYVKIDGVYWYPIERCQKWFRGEE